MTNIMKAGTYYIGDLCYVMHDEWNEVCKLIIEGSNCKEGKFSLKDGREFAIFNTAFGDGRYSDQYGFKDYCVDSGSIGCIRIEDIDFLNENNRFKVTTQNLTDYSLGNEVEFTEDFIVESTNGKMRFGHININTDDFETEESDEEWYYEDDYHYKDD